MRRTLRAQKARIIARRDRKMEVVEIIRSHALALPPLGKFALGMALIFGIPPLARRIRLPVVVGLLLSGIVLGPHALGAFGEDRPIADFLANLGKLLLMFVAGLDMDLARFRQTQSRSITFGLITASVRPFTARCRGWTLIWLRNHRSDRSRITARIAHTPRISGRG
jgi:predicted Kef-type K+ transport protein